MRGTLVWLVVVVTLACSAGAGAPTSGPAPAAGTGPATSAAPPAASPPPRDSLKVAYGATTGLMVPTYVAVTEGFLARYGIDAEITYTQGSRVGVPAIMAGELDVLQTAGPAVYAAQLGGGDIFWAAELIDKLVFSIMAVPDILRIEDLQGKRLAVSGVGTSSDTTARLVISRAGLRPGEDVPLVIAGGMAEIGTLLRDHLVDAGVTSFPVTTQLKRLGFTELVNLGDLDFPYPHTGLAIRRSWAEANRDLAVRVLLGVMDATVAVKSDRALAVRAVSTLLDSSDTELLAADYDGYVKYLREVPTPGVRAARAALEELAPNNPAAAATSPERLVDASFVEAAAARRR